MSSIIRASDECPKNRDTCPVPPSARNSRRPTGVFSSMPLRRSRRGWHLSGRVALFTGEQAVHLPVRRASRGLESLPAFGIGNGAEKRCLEPFPD
jgi:hypothetical protein